jgi:two-component system sensor histidine kinase VicK
MPEGGNIFVTAFKKDSDVKIEFVDEGIGIPSSLTFEIFEPMLSHGKQDGTGLGLSIARKIIQDHKGDISVDGELGEGTKILITLPAA